MFVLCFNSALGSTLELVCLCRLIGGGGVPDSSCLDVAEVIRLPSRLHHQILRHIQDADLFLLPFP